VEKGMGRGKKLGGWVAEKRSLKEGEKEGVSLLAKEGERGIPLDHRGRC